MRTERKLARLTHTFYCYLAILRYRYFLVTEHATIVVKLQLDLLYFFEFVLYCILAI